MFGPSKKQLWRELQRERDFRRDLEREWLDRIAALAGKPWTLPPRPAAKTVMTEDERRLRDEEREYEEL